MMELWELEFGTDFILLPLHKMPLNLQRARPLVQCKRIIYYPKAPCLLSREFGLKIPSDILANNAAIQQSMNPPIQPVAKLSTFNLQPTPFPHQALSPAL
jgi:hypothetical protein